MDNLTPEYRKKCMQHIRSSNTKPELLIAKELRKLHIYCTRNDKRIYGKPDFVFRRKKVVVFVDSDFWHAHPKRFNMPTTNVEYWKKKIERNKKRDKDVNRILKNEGWIVIRLWEYTINKRLQYCIKKILKALNKL